MAGRPALRDALRSGAAAAAMRLAGPRELAAAATSIGGSFLRGLRSGLSGSMPGSELSDAQLAERSSSAR
jgi:hypothetical protein